MLCGPARATPPIDALRGTIGSDNVAVYAQKGAFGTCLNVERQQPGQPWELPRSPFDCMDNTEQQNFDAHGGVVGWLNYVLPDINRVLASLYTMPTGDAPENKINAALNQAFKFSGNSLVAK